ncbi:hypothetical protein [Loigolactobacillus bifermentans]|uniref:Uncharacterized protein n=1 Tax=Loigolactobacillus bifermentans DSM 20003 TaxID=1423726 RepID=A0A0R1H7I3_9LACO|nr:hypothetical protein [Loigolactobacillus bifermentans]KRK40563.1 hypothetical protein FC07_GL000195 [Loigolactobacillus bifermentans DSM 20003]QGG59746.1 hypothetical protein LB003_04175 [Loigolactobacillus bifermentans]
MILFNFTTQAKNEHGVNYAYITAAVNQCEHPVLAAGAVLKLLDVIKTRAIEQLDDVFTDDLLTGMEELIHANVIKVSFEKEGDHE